MTHDQFVDALKKHTAATQEEWYLRDGCSLRLRTSGCNVVVFVATREHPKKMALPPQGFRRAGRVLGMTTDTIDDIMYAADGWWPNDDPLRVAICDAAGVKLPEVQDRFEYRFDRSGHKTRRRVVTLTQDSTAGVTLTKE